MENFTPIASTIGGMLIGLSASYLLISIGRVAGISGIASGIFRKNSDAAWRRAFILAMALTGLLLSLLSPQSFVNQSTSGLWLTALGGLLVGFGTRLGSGCTSGHGVCGVPRFSKRSVVAVLTFMGTGGVTTLALRLLGGAS